MFLGHLGTPLRITQLQQTTRMGLLYIGGRHSASKTLHFALTFATIDPKRFPNLQGLKE